MPEAQHQELEQLFLISASFNQMCQEQRKAEVITVLLLFPCSNLT